MHYIIIRKCLDNVASRFTPRFDQMCNITCFRLVYRIAVVGVIALIGSMVGGNLALGASFDCTRTSTVIERVICADPKLSSLDERMASDYSIAKALSNNLQQLVRDQRAWMVKRSGCTVASCIAEAMNTRIAELEVEQQLPPQSVRPSEPTSKSGLPVTPSVPAELDRHVTGGNSTRLVTEGPSLQAVSPASVPIVTNVSTSVVVALKSDAADLRGMISLFKEMIAEQKSLARPNEAADVAQQAISVLTLRLRRDVPQRCSQRFPITFLARRTQVSSGLSQSFRMWASWCST